MAILICLIPNLENADFLVSQDLRRHFEPFRVLSEKISRDEKTGVSKEVGFAR